MSESEPIPVENCMDWLAANLGYRALAPLTGTDSRALKAADAIIELYSYHKRDSVLEAFRLVVSEMQSTTQRLAYHVIARRMEWDDRQRVWSLASLEPKLFLPGICAFEPGGTMKDMREGAFEDKRREEE